MYTAAATANVSAWATHGTFKKSNITPANAAKKNGGAAKSHASFLCAVLNPCNFKKPDTNTTKKTAKEYQKFLGSAITASHIINEAAAIIMGINLLNIRYIITQPFAGLREGGQSRARLLHRRSAVQKRI